MKTKEQALDDLRKVVAEAAQIFMKLTPEESARRVYQPGGPSVEELTERIIAARATWQPGHGNEVQAADAA